MVDILLSWCGRDGAKLVLGLLLAASGMNLAAGVRRPLVERRILAANYYARAEEAAALVRAHVPPGEPLAVAGYAGDVVEEVDIPTWVDYRLKWLLYPRTFTAYEIRGAGDGGTLARRGDYHALGTRFAKVEAVQEPWVLCFRVGRPPVPPSGSWATVSEGSHYLLLRRNRP